MRRTTVGVLACSAAVLAAGCGSSHHSSAPTTRVPGPTTLPKPKILKTTAPPAAGAIATPTGMFRVTITPGGSLSSCAVPVQAGRSDLPFTVTITNAGTAPAPEARLSIMVTDPTPAASGAEVAALAFQGTCVNFTDPTATLAPGASTTYTGVVSNATKAATLTAGIIASGTNASLGTVTLALAG